MARRRERKWERKILLGADDGEGDEGDTPTAEFPRRSSGRSLSDPFLSASGLEGTGLLNDEDEEERTRAGSLLDPIGRLQPRQSRVNVVLKKGFYKLGLVCAQRACELDL